MKQITISLRHPETDEPCEVVVDYEMENHEKIKGLQHGEPVYSDAFVAEIKDITYYDEKGNEFSPSDKVLEKWYRPISDKMDEL